MSSLGLIPERATKAGQGWVSSEKWAQLPDDALMTTRQVAYMLGLSLTTVWRLCRDGELASVRFNRRTVRVRKGDLVRFVRGLEGKNHDDG